MRWIDQAPDIFFRSLSDWRGRLTLIEICKLVYGKEPIPLIVFPDRVREKILSHLRSKRTELGGLIFGKVYRLYDLNTSTVGIIEISESIESTSYESTGVSLRMDTEIWNRASSLIDGASIIVGWYHSHPNLGAFFSGTDRHNQAAVFYHDYSLGLVIDPIRNEEKWFIGNASREVPTYHIANNQR